MNENWYGKIQLKLNYIHSPHYLLNPLGFQCKVETTIYVYESLERYVFFLVLFKIHVRNKNYIVLQFPL